MKEIDLELRYYQKDSLNKLLTVLNDLNLDLSKINVLDIGCSIQHINYLSNIIKNITGINIEFPVNNLNGLINDKKYNLHEMDITRLSLNNGPFDFIYSLCSLEHIKNPSLCIDQIIKNLKPDGFCYLYFGPIWSSSKGHHVHDDKHMVGKWENDVKIKKSRYLNDGSFINDWSHLYLTKQEMWLKLKNKIRSKKLIEMIIWYIYDTKDINRFFMDQYLEMFNNKPIKIHKIKKHINDVPSQTMIDKLKSIYPYDDYTTNMFEIVFSKL
jgi:SAM-dependent methyltransferase